MAVEDLRLLAAIGDMNIGQPVTVVIEMPAPATPIEVSLDYVFAAEEFGFLRRAVLPAELSELSVVVELGAGFGRTAHLLLTHLRTIETYVIVDLPETLSLSRAYLHAALPEWLWSKLVFMDAEALEQGRCVFQEGVDLAIQIDGFQEMSPESIDGYFVEIIDHARLVFLSNPVGKYRPEVAGIVDVDPKVLAEVAKLGRCRGLLDPWDARDLAAVRRDYIDAYKPMGFEVVATEPSRLRPFYQHTLYRSPRSEGRAH
jgi:hypothetical protein